ncbi:flagellar basal body-associated FliL family protein [Thiorhodovibrio frisius]|uniref:Flagellar protein FliL n=1 Tax=Thiorhodovibrio frisius TaxID=631362 RepID=H8YZL6_9GAMM|nr:flagellar basal body-associated FliL family protein [Thiorhodovibrio frisius]EIC22143.1 flagellar basal body-associated protein [Thiorhodovibrio frisius]WPL24437.1 flagellar basal body-associated protein FliL [Thiorhodovibrio frisius]
MAKKPAKKDEAAAKGGSNKTKLIVMILLALILLGGGGAAAWFFLLSGSDEPVVEQELGPSPLIYFRLAKPITATLPPDEPANHLRVNVVLASRNQAVIDALELHTPIIRNDLLALFGNQTFAELNTPEGKEALREQVHETVTAILVRTGSPAGIENVFFDEIVMQ